MNRFPGLAAQDPRAASPGNHKSHNYEYQHNNQFPDPSQHNNSNIRLTAFNRCERGRRSIFGDEDRHQFN